MKYLARRGSAANPATVDDGYRDEAFRILRSNLEISIAGLQRPSIMVTSANPGDGKTLTAANLAATISAAGQRVVLVDLDLRHPDVHNYLGAHNEFGVTDVLLGRRPLAECLQFVETSTSLRRAARGFYVLAVGPPVENPAELLSTVRTARLVDALTAEADIVVIDAPPVLPVADTLSLGRVAGGVVVVAAAHQTTYPEIARAVELLTRNQARLLGLVLNKTRVNGRQSFRYGYPYGSDGD